MNPDLLVSQKPADLDLNCFQNWIQPKFSMVKVRVIVLIWYLL